MTLIQPYEKDLSVSEALIRVLKESGIEIVFGIPGGNSMKIFDALYDFQSEIRTVLVRHEAVAGVMAEVYGRLTGRPGVAIGQGLFMLTNALLGVLEAHLGSSPMLILADVTDGAPYSQHAPYQSGTGEYGTWDAKMSFSGVSKLTLESHAAVQAVQHTQLAVKHASAGEPGPVIVLFHSTALNGRVGPESTPRLFSVGRSQSSQSQYPDSKSIEQAVELLQKADQPVIIAGNGVRLGKAYDRLMQVAEQICAPVVTTAGGKGVFPENHPLALGVFGTFGLPAANAFVSQADVVLVVGSKLAPSDTALENPDLIDPRRQKIVQIDIEPRNAGWTFQCELTITAGVKPSLAAISEAIDALGNAPQSRLDYRKKQVENVRRNHGFFDEKEYEAEDIPMLPQRIIAGIIEATQPNAIITCDAGENRLFMTRFFQTRLAGTFLSPSATGGMGYAIPAALSAKIVYPRRQVVAVCGDGGFAMSLSGLITAMEENIPILTVVFNNSLLGWVKHYQQKRVIASEFANLNIAEIGTAMGCHGFRVETPDQLYPTLDKALNCGAPAVVDVVISSKVTYRELLSPLVAA